MRSRPACREVEFPLALSGRTPPMKDSDTELKQRLLASARRLFSERGRDRVSLREIAEHAGVSHGSVRYHFGSKDALYLASLRLSQFGEDIELPSFPPSGELSQDEASEQFRRFVRSFVAMQARVGSDQAAAMAFLRAEISRDGAPDPVFYRKVIAPGHEGLKRILRAIQPDLRDDKTLEIVAFNVIFQCVMVRTARGIVLRRLKARTLKKDDVNRIAETIITTTLSGIDALGE
ncbi:MAG: CerR family C-terminal domain-containing protein [Planctomycetota bacterium]